MIVYPVCWTQACCRFIQSRPLVTQTSRGGYHSAYALLRGETETLAEGQRHESGGPRASPLVADRVVVLPVAKRHCLWVT